MLTRKCQETETDRFQNYWDNLTFLTECQQRRNQSVKFWQILYDYLKIYKPIIYFTRPVYRELIDLVESINSYVFVDLHCCALCTLHAQTHTQPSQTLKNHVYNGIGSWSTVWKLPTAKKMQKLKQYGKLSVNIDFLEKRKMK